MTYTNSKLITNSDNAETLLNPTYFSPFQRSRNRSLAVEDVPQALNITYRYELPLRTRETLVESGLAECVSWWLDIQRSVPRSVRDSLPDFVFEMQPTVRVRKLLLAGIAAG